MQCLLRVAAKGGHPITGHFKYPPEVLPHLGVRFDQ